MDKIINRKDIKEPDFVEILERESHHDHEIIEDVDGSPRWKEDKDVRKLVDKIGLNDLIPLFHILGYDKNSEIYRKLYRNIGYSLSGYWEIFYWEMNNELADEYQPTNISKRDFLQETFDDLLNHATRYQRGTDEQKYLINDLERIVQIAERGLQILKDDKEGYTKLEHEKIHLGELEEGIKQAGDNNNSK